MQHAPNFTRQQQQVPLQTVMAAAGHELATFQQAIHAVFDHAGSPAVQQQATLWLNSFAVASEAWDACLAIIQPASAPDVQFFAANMLLSKARNEWGKLQEPRRSQLVAAVR